MNSMKKVILASTCAVIIVLASLTTVVSAKTISESEEINLLTSKSNLLRSTSGQMRTNNFDWEPGMIVYWFLDFIVSWLIIIFLLLFGLPPIP